MRRRLTGLLLAAALPAGYLALCGPAEWVRGSNDQGGRKSRWCRAFVAPADRLFAGVGLDRAWKRYKADWYVEGLLRGPDLPRGGD